jgi:hypothetical protein
LGGGGGGSSDAAFWSAVAVSSDPGGGASSGTSRTSTAGRRLPCAGPLPLGTQSLQSKRQVRCEGKCVTSRWSCGGRRDGGEVSGQGSGSGLL